MKLNLNKFYLKENNETLKQIIFICFLYRYEIRRNINLKWNQVNLSERTIRVMNTDELPLKVKEKE